MITSLPLFRLDVHPWRGVSPPPVGPHTFPLCRAMFGALSRRVSKGGHLGHVPPPLEPNAQRKNLRRLKDLRGQIQQKSPKFSKWIFFFFCLRHSPKSTLQFVIRKNVICQRKVCLSAAPPIRLLFLVQTDFSVTWVTA